MAQNVDPSLLVRCDGKPRSHSQFEFLLHIRAPITQHFHAPHYTKFSQRNSTISHCTHRTMQPRPRTHEHTRPLPLSTISNSSRSSPHPCQTNQLTPRARSGGVALDFRRAARALSWTLIGRDVGLISTNLPPGATRVSTAPDGGGGARTAGWAGASGVLLPGEVTSP